MSLRPSEYPEQDPKPGSKAKHEEQSTDNRPSSPQYGLAPFQQRLVGIAPIVARGAKLFSSQRLHTLAAQIIPAAITLVGRFAFGMIVAAEVGFRLSATKLWLRLVQLHDRRNSFSLRKANCTLCVARQ